MFEAIKSWRNNRGLHESGRPGVAVGGADSLLGQYLQNLTFFKALIILAFPIAFRNRLFVLASFRTNLEHDFSSLYKRVTFSKLCRFCFFLSCVPGLFVRISYFLDVSGSCFCPHAKLQHVHWFCNFGFFNSVPKSLDIRQVRDTRQVQDIGQVRDIGFVSDITQIIRY